MANLLSNSMSICQNSTFDSTGADAEQVDSGIKIFLCFYYSGDSIIYFRQVFCKIVT